MTDMPGRFFALRFSDVIDFKRFQRESRRLFLFCFLLSAIVHILGGVFIPVQRIAVFTPKAPETPWTVIGDIVVIPPPAANPYDTWKMNIPSHRMNRSESEMLRMRSRPGFRSADIPIPGISNRMRILRDRDLPTISLPLSLPFNDRTVRPYEPGFPEIPVIPGIDRYSPSASGIISMKEEMLTLDDLDTVQFMGIVIPNPENLQAVKGVIHLPLAVWGSHLVPAEDARKAIDGFTGFLKTYTQIKPVIDPPVYLDSPRLLEYPFIYITADQSFDLSEIEKKNLGQYLRNGGFAFIESYGEMTRDPGAKQALMDRAIYSSISLSPDQVKDILTARLNAKFAAPLVAAASMRQMLRDALGAQGKLAPIPQDHPLYHCFYDFDSPPGMDLSIDSFGKQPRNILEGITFQGRLVAVLSEKQYGIVWKEFGNPKPPLNIPLDSMGKMGINILVLGMLQQGGLALKVME